MAEFDLLSAIEKPGEPVQINDAPSEIQSANEEPIKEEPAKEPEKSEESIVEKTKEGPAESGEKEIPDYLKKINELSGGKYIFNTDDEAKKFFENHERISGEYEGLKDFPEKWAKIEEFVREKGKIYDPVSIVGGEENYKRITIANALAKKGDRSMAMKLVSTDLDAMSDLDVMSLFTQYQAPKLAGKDKIAKEAILSDLGIDTSELDFNNLELDDRQTGRLAIKAAEVRDKIRDAIEKVEIPIIENPIKSIETKFDEEKTKTEELKNKWKEAENRLKGSLTKLSFPNYGFDFEIKEDVSSVINEYLTAAAGKGWEFNEANEQKILKAIQEEIWKRDRSKILTALDTHIRETVTAELQKKYENREPLSAPNTPVLNDEKSAAQELYRRTVGI